MILTMILPFRFPGGEFFVYIKKIKRIKARKHAQTRL